MEHLFENYPTSTEHTMTVSTSAPPTLIDSKLELSGRVAVLTLQRDDVRNALTGTALVDDILQAVTWAEATPKVSVLVITGSGSAFSSGGNVKEMQDRSGTFAGSASPGVHPLGQIRTGHWPGVRLRRLARGQSPVCTHPKAHPARSLQ